MRGKTGQNIRDKGTRLRTEQKGSEETHPMHGSLSVSNLVKALDILLGHHGKRRNDATAPA